MTHLGVDDDVAGNLSSLDHFRVSDFLTWTDQNKCNV